MRTWALLLCLATLSTESWAVEPSTAELGTMQKWFDQHLAGENSTPPFSFNYGGKSSRELLKNWKHTDSTKEVDQNRTQHISSYTDSVTGLAVHCESIKYKDYPTIEWIVYVENTSDHDTPLIVDLFPLDSGIDCDPAEPFQLHTTKGNGYGTESFKPVVETLNPNAGKRFCPLGGKASECAWPYFNIAGPDHGVIVAIGWPGQWRAGFIRGNDGRVITLQAGQGLTHFRLHPREKVRTPRIVMQFWHGDVPASQNMWRRWMVDHNMPRPGGKPVQPMLEGSSAWVFGEMSGANEENQKQFVRRYAEERIKLDYWWMDAGWFVYKSNYNVVSTGTWEVDKARFPNGMRPISDYAHSLGVKTILWFMPEEVAAETWLYEKHPEWLIGLDIPVGVTVNGDNMEMYAKLLYLGNDSARNWVVEHFGKIIDEEGVDVYRTDCGLQQLLRIQDYWKMNDATDRMGITEIKHLTGLLDYLDEMLRRHPGLLIDNCCAGGNRLDVDTLQRSVPLWRSDFWDAAVGAQSMTYGLAGWLPFYGSAAPLVPNAYGFRSNMMPSLALTSDVRKTDLDYNLLRKLVAQWRDVSSLYLADYYPLTDYSSAEDAWVAWQFDRPETGEGVVHAFRRASCPSEATTLKLHGLDRDAVYTVTDLDTAQPQSIKGSVLMDSGLTVTTSAKPGAVVATYKRQ